MINPFTLAIFQFRLQFFSAVALIVFGLSAMPNRANAQALPHPDHIVVLIEENQPSYLVISHSDSSYAPYINWLAVQPNACVFSAMSAIEHPSQPNYFDLFSGSNQGVTDDNLPSVYPASFTTPNLAAELLAAGLSFKTYSQDLPSVGFNGESSGSYVRKHNPVADWMGTGTNQVPDSLNQPWTDFPSDLSQLPTVSFVVPNEDSDMHNGLPPTTITAGDIWFKEHMSYYINWAATNNTLFIYTFDEDDGLNNNVIPTLFYGPMVKTGGDASAYNLYSILRTIEDIYGLGHAGSAANTTPILDCWKSNVGINTPGSTGSLKVYPNPANSLIKFDGTKMQSVNATISVTDLTGRIVAKEAMPQSKVLELNTLAFAPGLYFYTLEDDNHQIETGKFIIAR